MLGMSQRELGEFLDCRQTQQQSCRLWTWIRVVCHYQRQFETTALVSTSLSLLFLSLTSSTYSL
jgi:hypothetical protein